MALNSTQINNAYLGSSNVSAIYLGANLIWPLSTAFWTNFNPNSCVSLDIISTSAIPSGLNWGDGSVSGIFSGTQTYRYCYAPTPTPPLPTGGLYNNLLAFYNFDGNINDVSNNGYNLSVRDAAYQSGTAKIGSASALFTSFGSCASGPGFSYPTNPFNLYTGQSAAFSFWYYPTQSITFLGGCEYAIFGSNFGNFGVAVGYVANRANTLYFNISSNNVTVTGNVMTVGQWQHFVCTHDAVAKTLSVYQNGNFVRSAGYSSITAPSQQFQGFAINGSAYGDGIEYGVPCQMDAVGIWTRNLSSGDVSLLFNGSTGIQYPF